MKAARSRSTVPRRNLAIITAHSNMILQLQVLHSSSRDPYSPFYLISTSFDGRTIVHLITVPFDVIPHPFCTSVAVRSCRLKVRTGSMPIHTSYDYVAIAPPPGQMQIRFFAHGAKCEFKSLQRGAEGTGESEDGLCPAGSLKIPWMRRLNAVRIAGGDRLVVLGLTKKHTSTLGIFRFD